ncbi:phosphoribosylaminoimidazole-succinocarboxamide synthase [gamma proteobacterium HTCC5015]|nr:phosphoribosylaminoimidazole-succinocarboxamide synthase [gamma proteobacterium HTCC5015]
MSDALYESQIQSLPLIAKGKVRDIYQADEDHLLIVTSDRISAFDVILPQAVPGKGRTLTEVARFWFERSEHIVPNHLSNRPLSDYLSEEEIQHLGGRGMLVKKLNALPIEAVVRGYIIGSGWKDYQATGAICGIELPEGLQLAEQLPDVIFTPATKAEVGDHDENISFDRAADLVGPELAEQVRDVSIRLYREAAEYARERGIIIADTKFEFGLDDQRQLVLIDEALTPDSSRFWPADEYRVGISPPSFDKQYVRDYLETLDWDKTAPGPELPESVLEGTAARYREAAERLTQ